MVASETAGDVGHLWVPLRPLHKQPAAGPEGAGP